MKFISYGQIKGVKFAFQPNGPYVNSTATGNQKFNCSNSKHENDKDFFLKICIL